LERSVISESVIGLRSIISPGSQLRQVVMMGADYYETPQELEKNQNRKRPNIGIGENSIIERAIIDKNVRIGRDVCIRPHSPADDIQMDNYSIRDGIVVIPKNGIIPDGTII
jgi:glucose-1-phosphate adenylyltransferase